MSTEAAFLAAISAEPDDDLRRLVYADWLDEHGRCDQALFVRLEVATFRGDKTRKSRDKLRKLGDGLPFDWLVVISRPRLAGTYWVEPVNPDIDCEGLLFHPDGKITLWTDVGDAESGGGGTWKPIGSLVIVTVDHYETKQPYSVHSGTVRGDRIRFSGKGITDDQKWNWTIERSDDPPPG